MPLAIARSCDLTHTLPPSLSPVPYRYACPLRHAQCPPFPPSSSLAPRIFVYTHSAAFAAPEQHPYIPSCPRIHSPQCVFLNLAMVCYSSFLRSTAIFDISDMARRYRARIVHKHSQHLAPWSRAIGRMSCASRVRRAALQYANFESEPPNIVHSAPMVSFPIPKLCIPAAYMHTCCLHHSTAVRTCLRTAARRNPPVIHPFRPKVSQFRAYPTQISRDVAHITNT